MLGASGGTGSFAVQVGRALGARVIAVCSSPEKAAIAEQLGAHSVIDLSKDDLAERLKALTAGQGVDVLYDPVGGELFDIASRRVRWNGRVLTLGYASGTIPQLPINLPLVKGYSVVGVHWAAAILKEVPLARSIVAELFQLVLKGDVSVQVDSRWPLADVGMALEKMRARSVTGKLVLSLCNSRHR